MGESTYIGAVCNRTVASTGRSTTISDAARMMRERHVGSLVVVEENAGGRIPVGMLTDRDIVISVVARGADPASTAVSEVMSDSLVSASLDDTLGDALALMRRHGVRRVPVTTADGLLYGIVSLDDLLRAVIEELYGFAQAIESGQWRETILPEARA